MFQRLIDNFSQYQIQLTGAETDAVVACLVSRKFRKYQYLQQQGEVNRYHYFILQGLTRTFQVDDKGSEHILVFRQEGQWATDFLTLFNQRPSSFHIDCLDETVVLQVANVDLTDLCQQYPKVHFYFQQVMQKEMQVLSQRLFSTLSQSALERYLDFINHLPHVEQRISNNQIASYLGVTPQSLSRIRRQVQQTS